VLLFASSIIAGWVENWFVLHRLDSASPQPALHALAGRAARAALGPVAAPQHLGPGGQCLAGPDAGLVPAFAGFFGLGLEVRHVTLSTGQVPPAATLGWQVLRQADFWWAIAGLCAIGPLNLAVSFYLAFHLALRAHNVGRWNASASTRPSAHACAGRRPAFSGLRQVTHSGHNRPAPGQQGPGTPQPHARAP
jgi:site-specific recombinase